MSGVWHAFESGDDPARCARPMRSGEPCARTRACHYQDRRRGDRHKPDRRRPDRPPKAEQPFVFFDTEGKGTRSHRLVYGAAVSETGEVILEVEAVRNRQPPPQVWLDALLEVGRRTRQRSIFAYGFGYDRTKMLEGLPDKTLYMLTRREHRPTFELKGRVQVEPLYWGDYILDLQGTRFSVAKLRRLPDGRPMRSPATNKRLYDRITVWDVLKFFQCPFVDALDAWRWKGDRAKPENAESELRVPDAELDEMRAMKSQRADFDKMSWGRVKTYCQGECRHGARLVRELVTACNRIGISLRRFDGAGSISDALMQKHELGRYMTAKSTDRWLTDSVLRRQLTHAIMCAFAGGRFETAYAGIVRAPVHVKDIASAYPYAMALHPCLACGRWDRVTAQRGIDRLVERADLALLHVECRGRDRNQAFGSFAHRDADGNVTFPLDNRTWVWKHEYLAARDAMRDRIRITEAFLYRTDCDHQPFKFMGELYLERLRIGKEGRGIAMKLGYNGCAGKTMQRVGSHRWQEYVWAGNTTSRTRAMLLEAIGRFRDQWEVCYVATDSVFATRDVPLAEPEETGTAAASGYGKPPLGGWEPSKAPYDGMCFVRPGIAFPLNATDEQMKEIKARGISKRVLLENVEAVIELMRSQARVGESGAALELSRRIFGGMKMCTGRSGRPFQYSLTNADDRGRSKYGRWFEQRIKVKIGARPKRFARMPGEEGMLLPWPDSRTVREALKSGDPAGESMAYGSTRISEEARALQELQDMLAEQPDLDAADLESVSVSYSE